MFLLFFTEYDQSIKDAVREVCIKLGLFLLKCFEENNGEPPICCPIHKVQVSLTIYECYIA